MSENKTGKYFKYAIGEIVLVVIGILIALSINNWNERQKEDTIRRNYFPQLILALENDKEYYKKMLSDFESFAEGYSEYRKVFTRKNLDVSSVILAASNINFEGREINFESTIINTLINTGDFRILPQNLRNELTNYLENQANIKVVANKNYGYANNLLVTASEMSNPNLLRRLQSHPDVFEYLNIENNYPKLIVLIDSYMFWKENGENETINGFNLLIKKADAIITLINEELKK